VHLILIRGVLHNRRRRVIHAFIGGKESKKIERVDQDLDSQRALRRKASFQVYTGAKTNYRIGQNEEQTNDQNGRNVALFMFAGVVGHSLPAVFTIVMLEYGSWEEKVADSLISETSLRLVYIKKRGKGEAFCIVD